MKFLKDVMHRYQSLKPHSGKAALLIWGGCSLVTVLIIMSVIANGVPFSPLILFPLFGATLGFCGYGLAKSILSYINLENSTNTPPSNSISISPPIPQSRSAAMAEAAVRAVAETAVVAPLPQSRSAAMAEAAVRVVAETAVVASPVVVAVEAPAAKTNLKAENMHGECETSRETNDHKMADFGDGFFPFFEPVITPIPSNATSPDTGAAAALGAPSCPLDAFKKDELNALPTVLRQPPSGRFAK